MAPAKAESMSGNKGRPSVAPNLVVSMEFGTDWALCGYRVR